MHRKFILLFLVFLVATIFTFDGLLIAKDDANQQRKVELLKLQERMREVNARCGAQFHGSAAIACINIGTEALMEQADYPHIDLIKQYDLSTLKVVEAFEQHKITEAAKNASIGQLSAATDNEINKRMQATKPFLFW